MQQNHTINMNVQCQPSTTMHWGKSTLWTLNLNNQLNYQQKQLTIINQNDRLDTNNWNKISGLISKRFATQSKDEIFIFIWSISETLLNSEMIEKRIRDKWIKSSVHHHIHTQIRLRWIGSNARIFLRFRITVPSWKIINVCDEHLELASTFWGKPRVHLHRHGIGDLLQLCGGSGTLFL